MADNDTQKAGGPLPDVDDSGGVSLGAGVDIVRAGDEGVDDVEVELYDGDTPEHEFTPEDKIRRLRERLATVTAERKEYLDGWQRIKADFVNYKRREEDAKAEFLKYAREELVIELLAVLESFSMAFANKAAWEKVDESWRKGVEHINSQLLAILANHGLTEVILGEGDAFDPKEHTAIEEVPAPDTSKSHKIAEVVQAGYKLNGKLIRSPKVRVYG
jgi:molecular chaperone GrpE